MENNLPKPSDASPSVRLFGVGDAGIHILDLLIAGGLAPELCVAVNSGGASPETAAAARKLRLESKRLRGLGSGGDPDRARQAAEEAGPDFKNLCESVSVVFIVAGLGGGSGTGISSVLARSAKAAGAFVLAFVTTPFDCEGSRRRAVAYEGLEELRECADGIICLPNQKIFKLIEENTTVLDTFKIANRLLADCVAGIWRLVSFPGLIEIHLDELYQLLQDRHAENTFAVAESAGADRAQAVIEKLLAHPLLDDGDGLSEAAAVLVSLTGGPNLTMAEVNKVMEQLRAKTGSDHVIMGACIDERFGERLAVTVIAAHNRPTDAPAPRGSGDLRSQLLGRDAGAKPGSRFLPPAPTLPPDQVQKLLSRQSRRRMGGRISARMRQGQLPLDIVSKGRFDKSEPTIHKGEDLDVPTFIRRGVPLN